MVSFTPRTWKNGSDGNTPVDADGLNRLEDGVSGAVNLAVETAEVVGPMSQQRPDPMPAEFLAYSKGGTVGTSGKAPVAFRFDDWQDDMIVKGTIAAMSSRGLFGSIVLCSELKSNPWNQVITWDVLREWNRVYGMEVWSHGTNHNSPYAAGYAGLVREIVTSKEQIEAQGIRCMGWAMPGVGAPGYGSFLEKPADWQTDAGKLLTATYGVVETDMTAALRHLPGGLRYGLGHATITDGMTLTEAKAWIDGAINLGMGIELMSHIGNLDKPGFSTTSDWLGVLDYVVQKRDEGLIEVVTPSTLAFCDPNISRRLDLIGNGSFEAPVPNSAAAHGNWRNMDGTNRVVIEVPDGPKGTPTKVFSARTSALAQQVALKIKGRGLAGQTLILDAWARCEQVSTVTTATARFIATDTDVPANFTLDKMVPVTLAWQRIRVPFTPPPGTDNLSLSFGRGTPTGSGRVQWDDVHVYVA